MLVGVRGFEPPTPRPECTPVLLHRSYETGFKSLYLIYINMLDRNTKKQNLQLTPDFIIYFLVFLGREIFRILIPDYCARGSQKSPK